MPVTDKFFSTIGGLGDDEANYSATTDGSGITLSALTDPTGSGYGTVGKFGLAVGDTRCELSGHVDDDPTFGTDYWTWFSFYIPGNWRLVNERMSLWQIHEQADTSPADVIGDPQLYCYLLGTRLVIENNFHTATQTTSLSQITNRLLHQWDLSESLGRWTDMVVRATWSVTAGGALSIWRNRRRVFVDAATDNAFNNAVARGGNEQPFHKIGLYGINGAASVANYVLHRGVRRGTEYTSFDSFLSACGSSDTELEGFVVNGVSL